MARSRRRLFAESVAGLTLALALLWIFLRGTSPSELAAAVHGARLAPLAAVLALNLLSLLIRSIRWRQLLRPLDPALGLGLPWRCFIIGFALSALLPGRPGELVRPYLLARGRGLPFSAVFATVVVERVVDLTVVLLLFSTGFAIPGALGAQPEGSPEAAVVGALRLAALAAAGAALGVAAFLALLRLRPDQTLALLRRLSRPLPGQTGQRLAGMVEAFAGGLAALRGPPLLLGLAGTTALTWLVLTLSFGLVLHAFGLDVPVERLPFFTAVMALGVALPTPAGAGTYHAALIVVVGELWGFGTAQGGAVAACALVSHALGIAPVVVLGVAYLGREGLAALREVREDGGLRPQ